MIDREGKGPITVRLVEPLIVTSLSFLISPEIRDLEEQIIFYSFIFFTGGGKDLKRFPFPSHTGLGQDRGLEERRDGTLTAFVLFSFLL